VNFLTTVPVSFINTLSPLGVAVVIFCATTLGTLTIVGTILYIFFRPIRRTDVFASLENISEKFLDFFVTALATCGAYTTVFLLKLHLEIPRPGVFTAGLHALLTETDYGFPSSHAAVYSALAVSLFFINKRAGYVTAVIALVIGIARVLAGVHTPLDILGGYIVGTLFAVVIDFVTGKLSDQLAEHSF